jgi:outer membrane PBP1 activator LpoA protein
LVLVVVALAAGIMVLAAGRWSGLLFLVVAGLLIWGHYRESPVRRAYRALSDGKSDRAAKLIARVRDPRRLDDRERAHFCYVTGMLAAERGDLTAAERQLEQAMQGPEATADDRAQIACYLAEIAIGTGDLSMARRQIEKARALEHKPEVDKTIADLVEMLGDPQGGEEE